MQDLMPRPIAAVHAPTFSAEESATAEAAARARAHAFWGRR